jgi:hypothetical protein
MTRTGLVKVFRPLGAIFSLSVFIAVLLVCLYCDSSLDFHRKPVLRFWLPRLHKIGEAGLNSGYEVASGRNHKFGVHCSGYSAHISDVTFRLPSRFLITLRAGRVIS